MKRLAVCGKGGVGKTTVAALVARHLARRSARCLLVDADHAGGLEVALGLSARRTLNDVRVEALAELRARDASRKPDLAAAIDYALMASLVEQDQMAFLALGRPEDRGCFCSVNTVLRRALQLLTGDFDVTLVDAEAGIEQINRDVVGHVEHLLLVADTSVKALRVAETAAEVAGRLSLADHVHLVMNRIQPGDDRDRLAARTTLPIVAWLPDDPTVRAWDADAKSFLDLPDGPAPEAIQPVLEAVGV